jgi:hypothetical protein
MNTGSPWTDAQRDLINCTDDLRRESPESSAQEQYDDDDDEDQEENPSADVNAGCQERKHDTDVATDQHVLNMTMALDPLCGVGVPVAVGLRAQTQLMAHV